MRLLFVSVLLLYVGGRVLSAPVADPLQELQRENFPVEEAKTSSYEDQSDLVRKIVQEYYGLKDGDDDIDQLTMALLKYLDKLREEYSRAEGQMSLTPEDLLIAQLLEFDQPTSTEGAVSRSHSSLIKSLLDELRDEKLAAAKRYLGKIGSDNSLLSKRYLGSIGSDDSLLSKRYQGRIGSDDSSVDKRYLGLVSDEITELG